MKSWLDQIIAVFSACLGIGAFWFYFHDQWMYPMIEENGDEAIATVEQTVKDVRVRTGSTIQWSNAMPGMALSEGTSVFTGARSSANVKLDEGDLFLGPDSLVVLRRHAGQFSTLLVDGSLQTQVQKGKSFRLHTTDGEIELMGQGLVQMERTHDGGLNVEPSEGSVELKVNGETKTIGKGERGEVVQKAKGKIEVHKKQNITVIAPTHQFKFGGGDLILQWQKAEPVEKYKVSVWRGKRTGRPLLSQVTEGTQFLLKNFKAPGEYYWSIQGYVPNEDKPSFESAMRQLTLIKTATAPAIVMRATPVPLPIATPSPSPTPVPTPEIVTVLPPKPTPVQRITKVYSRPKEIIAVKDYMTSLTFEVPVSKKIPEFYRLEIAKDPQFKNTLLDISFKPSEVTKTKSAGMGLTLSPYYFLNVPGLSEQIHKSKSIFWRTSIVSKDRSVASAPEIKSKELEFKMPNSVLLKNFKASFVKDKKNASSLQFNFSAQNVIPQNYVIRISKVSALQKTLCIRNFKRGFVQNVRLPSSVNNDILMRTPLLFEESFQWRLDGGCVLGAGQYQASVQVLLPSGEGALLQSISKAKTLFKIGSP